MPRLTTIDRRVNPVQDLTLLGLVSGYVEFGAAVLDDDPVVVRLEDPAYLTSLPDEIVVSLSDATVYPVLEDPDVVVVLEEDAISVEACTP